MTEIIEFTGQPMINNVVYKHIQNPGDMLGCMSTYSMCKDGEIMVKKDFISNRELMSQGYKDSLEWQDSIEANEIKALEDGFDQND